MSGANPSAGITAQICTAGPTGERMAGVNETTVCGVQSEMCRVTSCRHSDVNFVGIVTQIQLQNMSVWSLKQRFYMP